MNLASRFLYQASIVSFAFLLLSSCVSDRHPAGRMGGMHAMHDLESEYEFLVEMIPHHQEALDTSRLVVARTVRPELRD